MIHLHDQSGIFIAFFGERIELSDGIIEGGLGESEKMISLKKSGDVGFYSRAGVLWIVQNFVVENGVIKSKTKSDRVGGLNSCYAKVFSTAEKYIQACQTVRHRRRPCKLPGSSA